MLLSLCLSVSVSVCLSVWETLGSPVLLVFPFIAWSKLMLWTFIDFVIGIEEEDPAKKPWKLRLFPPFVCECDDYPGACAQQACIALKILFSNSVCQASRGCGLAGPRTVELPWASLTHQRSITKELAWLAYCHKEWFRGGNSEVSTSCMKLSCPSSWMGHTANAQSSTAQANKETIGKCCFPVLPTDFNNSHTN